MERRDFIKTTGLLGGAVALSGPAALARPNTVAADSFWLDGPMRWAQLAFVERDPGHYDPDFWLSYFKRIHADGALLSAGGVVAFTRLRFHCITGAISSAIPTPSVIWWKAVKNRA
jgi:hypothetical protein